MSRQRILLILSLLLVLALGYAWWATPRQRRVTKTVTASQASDPGRQDRVNAGDDIVDLRISRFDQPFAAPKTNLFGPVFPEVKPVRKKVVKRAPPRVEKLVPPPVPVQVEPPPPPPRPEPMPQLTVMGFLNKGDRMTAFLNGGNGEIYLVKAGDDFAGDLLVREVSPSAIVIARPRTGQTMRLPLGKPQTQRIPDSKFQSGRPNFEPPAEPEPAAGNANTGQPQPPAGQSPQQLQQQQQTNQSPVMMKLQ